jgi:hypothetical protein
MRPAAAVLLFLITTVHASAEPSEYAKKFLAKFKEMNTEKIKEIEAKMPAIEKELKAGQAELSRIKAGKIEPLQKSGMKEVNGQVVWIFKTKKEQQDKVDAQNKIIAGIQDKLSTLAGQKIALQSVEAPEIPIARMEVGYVGFLVRGSARPTVKVLSVSGASSLLVNFIGTDIIFFLEGIPTEGIVDGKEFEMKRVYEIAKTKEYVAASGAKKTVFVLVPAD